MLRFLVLLNILLFASQNQAEDDSSVLLRLKNSVDDPSQTLSSWNSSTTAHKSFCLWNGVTCTTQSRVSGLVLESLTLAGSLLLSTIGALPFLLELSVSRSTFTDAISMNSSSACSLESVKLFDNFNMTFVFHPVQELLLGCKGLKVLNLSDSQSIVSKFPIISIGNVLEVMDLSSNSFNGDLSPILFSECKRLRYLDLSHNNFTGELPDDLTRRCTRLKKLSLAYNKFHGELFPSIGSLRYLESLDASFNNFTGTVPEIHNNLRHLNLSSNGFTSTSNEVCQSQNSSRLESLILVNNKLTGRVLDRIANCSRLKMLDVSFNSLNGEIPRDVCGHHPKLEHFLAWVNNLKGTVPPDLAACINLRMILLSFNSLSENIPIEVFFSLKNLQWLSLSNNRLSGELPRSFEHADEILVLNLSNNSLEGKLPTSVTMSVIDLRGNNFSGTIPVSINGFTKGRVGKPNVAGTNLKLVEAISRQTCKCMDTSLVLQGISLEEAEDMISQKSGGCHCNLGYTPAILYAFPFPAYTPSIVDISYNRLVGGIPTEIGSSMENMIYFSASHNFLTGTIPSEIGGLKKLKGMDLSFNHLEGGIPDSFGSLSFLTGLNVSYNDLSGPIPQAGQLTTLDPSSYTGNPGLCGVPLSPCKQTSIPNDDNFGTDSSHDDQVALAIELGAGMVAFGVSCTMVLINKRKSFLR